MIFRSARLAWFTALIAPALCAGALPVAANAAPGGDPEIATSEGVVVGAQSEGMKSWLGIPYAAPPVGALRWRPPVEPRKWSAPLQAKVLPSACAQNADLGVFAKAGGAEDCLYLNVYTPAKPDNSVRKPVVVWIHGGALRVGQGADYDPSNLVQAGAVVVTLNYRLGLFGFFDHPALDREKHPTGNYGLMDQQAALRWVHKNIAAFGGDPDRVTIAGESSGGASVLVHVLSPGSAGLFQRAIAMSGSALMLRPPAFGAARPLSMVREQGIAFAATAGCASEGIGCLRKLSAKQILDVQGPYATNQILVDGKVVPDFPGELFRAGKVNQVTLINGNTRDEGLFFAALEELSSGKALSEDGYPNRMISYFGGQIGPRVLSEYPVSEFSSPGAAYAAAITDSLFACPGLALNNLLAGRIPLYAYEFADDTAPSYIDPVTFPLLAAHTSELSYIFNGFSGANPARTALNPLQQSLSKEMVSLFVGGNLPEASRYDPVRQNVLTYQLPRGRVVEGRFAKNHHCVFWDKTGAY